MIKNNQRGSFNITSLKIQIDRKINRYEQVLFSYHSGKKYIQLTELNTERKTNTSYSDYQAFPINPVVASLILDEDLSVVQQSQQYKPNLEIKLQELKKVEQQKTYLSFLHGKQEVTEQTLQPIPYMKYFELYNFQIGRAGFGREIQTYKIRSDDISRNHCEIMKIKSSNNNALNQQKTIYNFLTTKSPYHSKLRLIPRDIWEKIFEYSRVHERYLIRDCGSRNGTFIHEIGTRIFELRENFQYQVDGECYGIQIKKIFTSANTPNQSILQHNAKVDKMIEQFKRQVSWCYYQSAKKSMLISETDIKNNSTGKFMVLVFKLKTREPHEFYFIGIMQNCQRKFSMGCHQEIDVYPEQYDMPSFHASIMLDSGKWTIQASHLPISESQQNSSVISNDNDIHKKIWIRPPKQSVYTSNTNKKYKIKLGYSNIFQLKFNNF